MMAAEALAHLLLEDVDVYDKLVARKKPTTNTSVHQAMRKRFNKTVGRSVMYYPLDRADAQKVAAAMDRIRKAILDDVGSGGPAE